MKSDKRDYKRYTYRDDYKKYDYLIPHIKLDFIIERNIVNVTTEYKLIKQNFNTNKIVLKGKYIIPYKIYLDNKL